MAKIKTRTGDGYRIEMTEAEVRADLERGTQDAAERAKVDALSADELAYLYDIFA